MSVRRAAVLLAAAAVGASTAVAATATATFPQTVEVDLVFPRNETYAPSAVFPIVFAFQNAPFAPPLDPTFVMDLWQGHDHNTTIYLNDISLGGTNFSAATSDAPLYVYTFATNLNTTNNGADAATQYNFVWSFGAGNCSVIDGVTTLGGGFIDANIVFTIARDGGAAPDIAPGNDTNSSSGSTCGLSHLAFNLTGTLPVPDPTKYDGHDTCAVFSDTTPTPVANPCAATADAAAASSIAAAMTSRACAVQSPLISCPAKNAGAAASGSMTIYVWTGCLALLCALVLE
ncbi:hypothetical protein SCUCBS95973_001631 [Sporothrix curviconia]|uniref:DUF7136 domain-containing protein n=1 Tax=Sporothrix curviconia TaxID=1260050 RepID=A0ABP0B056_9PEZI